jgi:hypothetical protein
MSNKMLMLVALVVVVWFIWHKTGYKNPMAMVSGK